MFRAVCVALLVLVALVAAVVAAGAAWAPGAGVRGGAAGAPSAAVAWGGPAECFPPAMVADCLAAARAAAPGFGPLDGAGRAALGAAAARVAAAHGVPVDGAALEAMRTIELACAARTCGTRAQREGEELLAAHRRGEPVLAIAAAHRLPPLTVLRQILTELGYGAAEARAMIADPAVMPDGLGAQAAAVAAADLGSRENAARIRADAERFEGAVGRHLRRLGLEFQTEDDLRAAEKRGAAPQPTSERPAPQLTPDFLLTRPVWVKSGKKKGETAIVNWIDAKNYPYYGSSLLEKSLANQAKKYSRAFGPGAFVFAGGVMCGARVPPAEPLMLSGAHLRE